MAGAVGLATPSKEYSTPDRSQVPAFPGADGAGKYATGGAGGTVYTVTSLADDGSEGTFRWAINKKGHVPSFLQSAASLNYRNL